MKLDFMKYKFLYFFISVLFLVPGIFSLVKWGLKPAVDFTGGSILEMKTQNSKLKTRKGKIEEIVKKEEVDLSSIQESGETNYILRMEEIDKNKKEEILRKLKEEFDEIEEIRFETVGPTLGKELIKKTILAIILAAGFILLYVGWRFKDKKYGICAILAMFHDSLILLGTFSLLGYFYEIEVDTLFVTAVLTTLSFSVHDTVIVYDRIRESRRIFPETRFDHLVNKAVAETLGRSVNNSMTIIFMLLCLYLLGGETIKWFIFALLIGTISGTYSSTFTAAPLLVVWEQLKEKRRK